jgi:hypothetical protein
MDLLGLTLIGGSRNARIVIDLTQLGNALLVRRCSLRGFQMPLRRSRIRTRLQFVDERLGLRNLGATNASTLSIRWCGD